MGVYNKNNHIKSKKLTLSCFLFLLQSSIGIKLGLFAGDYKKHVNPLLINKFSHHSPVFINVHPGLKLPEIRPVSKLSSVRAACLSRPLTRRSLPLLAPKLPLSPMFLPLLPPKLPLLPMFPPPLLPLLPPLIPPLIPHFPLVPPALPPVLPHIPFLPPLSSPLRRVSLFDKKTPLEKALEWKPFEGKKDVILEKLLDLKKRGSLSTAEFVRFKTLLL